MDVSATGPTVAAAVPQTNAEAIGASIASPASAPVLSPITNAAPHSESVPESGPGNHSALAPAIAKLFGHAAAAPPGPIRLDVSYRVLRDPNVIVTVFSDPKTGQEVAQFPPEILFNLAQFFDQQHGVTFDRQA